jgi:thiol-disulfide isomerase/thioredoxin
LNGDGKGLDDRSERFDVADGRITANGTTFGFKVDHWGRSIALRRLAETLPNYSNIKRGDRVPALTLTDIAGKKHSLAEYRGKVVLVDFWSVGCGPCRVEAPLMNQFYDAHRSAGFEIVGIAPDAGDAIREFQRQFGYAWPQVTEAYDGEAHRRFRIDGYPTHFLIGRDGTVAAVGIGGIDGTSFLDAMATALKK